MTDGAQPGEKRPDPHGPVEVLPPPVDAAERGAASRGRRAGTVWQRVFAIGARGWVRLGLACLGVGLIVRAANLNPFSGDFSLPEALGAIVTAVAGMFAWLVANGWAPFLLGVVIVLPVFVLWRLASMPFRQGQSDTHGKTRHDTARWTPRK